MKAVRIHGHGGPEQLVYEDAPKPIPQRGEALLCGACTVHRSSDRKAAPVEIASVESRRAQEHADRDDRA